MATTTSTPEIMPEIVEGSVSSADGARIGYLRLGTGPALVIAHGSISAHPDWLPVARLLAARFTCYLMDRRGRGRSEDGDAPYAIEREYEDIAAVLAAAGSDASLLGHSFGAICALGTALRVPVRRLVLYEPPLPVGGRVAGAALDDYRNAVAEGRLDEALTIGLLRFVGLPAGVVANMRSAPSWQRMLPLAPTWVREIEAIDGLGPDVRHYGAIRCPVLLLVGTLSAERPLRAAAAALEQVLPDVRCATLQGQGHMAARTAPSLVAELIASFLSESSS